MSVTDQAFLSEIQGTLIEPEDNGVAWASGFWTSAEVVDYMNARQREFLKETFCLVSSNTLVTVPGPLRHPLPQDWVATYDVQWRTAAGVYKELPRSSSFEADLADPDWIYESQPIPDACSDGDQGTLLLQIMPLANDAGLLEILYVAVSATLGTGGVLFDVPDEFIPAIKWGVISDMLSKVGRAHDPSRAAYAEARYQEGIMAVQVMLGRFS